MLKRVLIIYLLLSAGLYAELKVGDLAPTFFAKTLDKKSFFLSDSLKRNNRPIVFSFFATWCNPCREEIPVVDTISTLYPHIDFYLVNVSGTQKGKKTHREDPNLVKIMAETTNPEGTVLRGGDVEVVKLELWSSQHKHKFDLSNIWKNISIYEDIETNYIRGEVTISDSKNILMDVPIITNEKLIVEFKTSSHPDSYKFYRKC